MAPPWWCHCLVVLVQLARKADQAGVPAVIVFGDSSVDPGNNNAIPTVARSNFHPYGRDFITGEATGRFSNGRLATDFIAEALGLKAVVPAYLDRRYGIGDFATGVSFASAATGYDNVTAEVLLVMPIWRQLELFKDYQVKLKQHLGSGNATATLSRALYIISIGTNDFMENYYTSPLRSMHFTVSQYEDFLAAIAGSFVSSIYRLGAREIRLTGLCPMGCLPLVRTVYGGGPSPGCKEEYNAVARSFNGKLQALVQELNSQLPGVRVVYSDVYELFLKVIQQPHAYGFENAVIGCCATGVIEMSYACERWNPFTCDDAAKYVFWDAFHPSEAMNRLIAHHAINTTLKPLI